MEETMAKKLRFEDVKKQVRKIVAEIAEISEKELKNNAKFSDDLGVDSMKALEIVAVIEKKFRYVSLKIRSARCATPMTYSHC